jgi:hypothetical protein
MTGSPRDDSVLIRTSAIRISRGLPRVMLAIAVLLLLVEAFGQHHIGNAMAGASCCGLIAGGIVLLRQVSALTEISSVGIHKAGLEWDPGFRTWNECATIHTLWLRPYWYLGRNLLWAVLNRAYVPDPRLLDDNNVRLFYEAVRYFAPDDHPLLTKLRANPRVQDVVRDLD